MVLSVSVALGTGLRLSLGCRKTICHHLAKPKAPVEVWRTVAVSSFGRIISLPALPEEEFGGSQEIPVWPFFSTSCLALCIEWKAPSTVAVSQTGLLLLLLGLRCHLSSDRAIGYCYITGINK